MLDASSFKTDCDPYVKHKTIWVAYSGGIDSHVLLHLANSAFGTVKAVHINHGLSPNANYWQQHCQQVCAQLNIPLSVIAVTVKKLPKQSLEDAARIARRQAWQNLLSDQDLLLVAHHAQDQAETILYRLFRGSGPQGLAGMQQQTKIGSAQIYRPLLNIEKQQIVEYAQQHKLLWITDESNANQDYDRNYIRASVLPIVQQRWPAIVANINRAGLLNRQLLDCMHPQTIAKLQSLQIMPSNALDLSLLLQEQVAWQIELLRAWLQQHKLQPSYQQITRIQNEVIAARRDAQPRLKLGNKIICRYQQQLFALGIDESLSKQNTNKYSVAWNLQEKITLPNGVALDAQQIFKNANILQKLNSCELQVLSYATGRKARKIFQKFAVPVWQRQAYPAVYANGKLVAIVGLWNATS